MLSTSIFRDYALFMFLYVTWTCICMTLMLVSTLCTYEHNLSYISTYIELLCWIYRISMQAVACPSNQVYILEIATWWTIKSIWLMNPSIFIWIRLTLPQIWELSLNLMVCRVLNVPAIETSTSIVFTWINLQLICRRTSLDFKVVVELSKYLLVNN